MDTSVDGMVGKLLITEVNTALVKKDYFKVLPGRLQATRLSSILYATGYFLAILEIMSNFPSDSSSPVLLTIAKTMVRRSDLAPQQARRTHSDSPLGTCG